MSVPASPFSRKQEGGETATAAAAAKTTTEHHVVPHGEWEGRSFRCCLVCVAALRVNTQQGCRRRRDPRSIERSSTKPCGRYRSGTSTYPPLAPALTDPYGKQRGVLQGDCSLHCIAGRSSGFPPTAGLPPGGLLRRCVGRISDRVILFACLGHFIPFEFGGTSCTLLAVARISSVGGDYCCFRAHFLCCFFRLSREKKKLCSFNRVPLFFSSFFLLKPRVSYDYYYSTVPNEVFFFLLLLVFLEWLISLSKQGWSAACPCLHHLPEWCLFYRYDLCPANKQRTRSPSVATHTIVLLQPSPPLCIFFCVLIGCSLQTARRSRVFLPPEKVGPPRASLELSIDPVWRGWWL